MLGWISNGGGAADELREAPLSFSMQEAQADQPSEDARNVRSKDACVHVGFVDHYVFEVSEELTPFLVLREEGGVEHIGIREEDAGVFADILAVCEGGVTVVCLRRDAGS